MILSRVADALYWMGRYLERAENVARLLLVTEEMATEVVGLDEELARGEWNDLRVIFPGPGGNGGPPAPRAAFGPHALAELSIGARHPYSVFFSLRKARENARTVREALTIEVFVNLNETYRELEGYSKRPITDLASFGSALANTHRGILSTAGAIEQTLARDPGWLFLKLGESLERVFRTAVVLRVKLPSLSIREPAAADLPLYFSRWRSLLRGLSSLENYRKVHGARLEPADALQFLLFDPHAPRSLLYGTNTVKDLLEKVSGARGLSLPARVVGKLAGELAYQSKDVLEDGESLIFLDHVIEELGRAHDTLSATYFGT